MFVGNGTEASVGMGVVAQCLGLGNFLILIQWR